MCIARFFIYDQGRNLHVAKVDWIIPVGEWFHVAAVSGPGGMRLYLDGRLAGAVDFKGSFKSIGEGVANYLGKSNWPHNAPFQGALDEFRVWSVERSAEEIQRFQFQRLKGDEPGLAALWNFDEGDARDATPNHQDGALRGGARCQPLPYATAGQTRRLILIQGTVQDVAGRPESAATVQLYQHEMQVHSATSDPQGQYQFYSFSSPDPVDLLAFSSSSENAPNRAQWRLDISLQSQPGPVDFSLASRVGISGTLSGLDDSPHSGVCVELLRDNKMVQRTMSGPNGEYSFPNIKPGRYRVRCALGGFHIPPTMDESGDGSTVSKSGEIELAANQWRFGVDFRFPPARNKGSWRLFTSNNGLPSNRITSAHNSGDGRIWIGTYGGGLVLYDVNEFTVFDRENGLPSNEVLALDSDAKGMLWIATLAGISRWDQGRFQNMPTETQPLALAMNSEGRVLWSQVGGLFQANLGRGERIASVPPKPFFAITSDAKGNIWLGSDDSLGCWKDSDYREFSSKEYRAPGRVVSVVVDSRQQVWFSAGDTLVRFDGTSFRQFDVSDGLPDKAIHGLLVDRSGTLWAGSERGISAFTGIGFLSHHWPDRLPGLDRLPQGTSVGLTQNQLGTGILIDKMGLCEDPDGGLWIPTAVGVFRFDPSSILSFTTADGLPGGGAFNLAMRSDGVLALAANDYTLATVEVERLLSKTNIATVVKTVKHGLSRPTATMFDRAGDLWMASQWGGVRVFDGKTFELKHSVPSAKRMADDYTTCFGESPAGEMWVGTAKGLYVLRLYPQVSITFPLPEAKDASITVIQSDHAGRVWIGTERHGLLCSENGQARRVGAKLMGAENAVNALCENPAGVLWIGTDRGLYQMTRNQNEDHFDRFSRRSGLPSDAVQSLHPNRPQGVWAGTAAGLCRFDGNSWTVLDSRDGLAGNQVRSIAEDAKGRLWLACEYGLSCYVPNQQGSRAEITRIEPNPGTAGIPAGQHTSPGSAGIPAGTNRGFMDLVQGIVAGTRTTIHYRGVDSKTLPSKRHFRIRLQGPSRTRDQSDAPWQPPTLATRFEFTPEQPGRYTFEVQAIDRDLNYSAPARLHFDVIVPWHRTPAAMLLAGVTFITLLGAAAGYGRKYYQQRGHAQQLQMELLEKERSANRAKSLFLANMSHDIRTPLNAILGYAQILQRTPGLPGTARLPVETIRESGTGLLALINSILDISKIEAGGIELQESAFDLAGLVTNLSSTFRLSCQQKSLEWRVLWRPPGSAGIPAGGCGGPSGQTELVPWPDSPPRLMACGDESKVRRILINLLSNAIKFTETGSVTLRLHCPEISFSQPRHDHPQRLDFVFEVIDTGPGIGPESRQGLFEPFARSRTAFQKEGSGLGLAIARRLALVLGGDLTFDSIPGRGSCFRVEFPLTILPAGADSKRLVPGAGLGSLSPGQRARVLVVDDEPHNRDVLRQLLELVGAEVVIASSGQEALAQVAACQPQLVFMDIWMPDLDGLQTARLLHEQWNESCPKLIAYSASTMRHERQEYLRSGFDDFLAKPATIERIRECLSANLRLTFEPGPDEHATGLRLDRVCLPEELVERMLAAAEIYSSTELMRFFDEIEPLGPEEEKLARHLRQLNQQSAMPELVSLLQQIPRKKG